METVSYPKVTGLHPKVVDTLEEVLNEAKARGLNVSLHSGLRTAEEQDKLYALGRTIVNPDGKSADKPMGNIVTNAQAFSSWHNFGLALDIVFKDSKGNFTWNKSLEEWAQLGVVGKMFGFQWGGDWTKFPDYPHFQMLGKIESISQAKKILFEQGLDKLWALI